MLETNDLINRKSIFRKNDEDVKEDDDEYDNKKRNNEYVPPKQINYWCFLMVRIIISFFCIYAFLFAFLFFMHKYYSADHYKEFKYNTFYIKSKAVDLTDHYFHEYPHLHLYMNENENITNPCSNPETVVCDNYKGDLVTAVTENSVQRINRRVEHIIIHNKTNSIHVNNLFLKKTHIESLNKLYKKCQAFYKDGYLLQILNSNKMRDLFVIVDEMKKYDDIGKTFGKLYARGINVPIKLTVKGVHIGTTRKKMLSMEMSGYPLLYILKGKSKYKESLIHLFDMRVGEFLNLYWKDDNKKKKYMDVARRMHQHLMDIGLKNKMFHNAENEFQTVDQLKKEISTINIEDYFGHSSINEDMYMNKPIEINKLDFFRKLDRSIREFDVKEWRVYLKMNIVYTIIRWFTLDDMNDVDNDRCMKFIKSYYPLTYCRGFKSVLSKTKYHDEFLSAAGEVKRNTQLLVNKYIEIIDHNPKLFCLSQRKNIDGLKERLRSIDIRSCKCSNIDYMNRRMNISLPSVLKEEGMTLDSNLITTSTFSDIIFSLNEFQTRRLEHNHDYDPYYEDIYEKMLTGNAFYDVIFKNQLIIPPGMFVFPYYSKNFKSWQLFSNLMKSISHELAHSVDHFFYKNHDLSFEESSCYDAQIDCIIDLYNRFNTDKKDVQMGERTCIENKADILGLYVSFYTWMDMVKDLDKHLIDNYKQHFFIFYHQTLCQSGTQKKDEHAEDRLRLSLPVTILKHEYKMTFDCKSDYFYEKLNKCLL